MAKIDLEKLNLTPEQRKRINRDIEEEFNRTGFRITEENAHSDEITKALDDSIEAVVGRVQAQGGAETRFRDIPGNILPSGARAIGDIARAIASPIETGKAVGATAVGGVQKLIPGEQEQEQTFDQVTQFFKDRYGSTEAAKQTFINDPVGAALDIASVLTGVGGVTRGAAAGAARAGATGTSRALAGTSRALTRAGRLTDPVRAAGLGLKQVAKGVKKGTGAAAGELFGVTTGVGTEVLKEAFRNPSPELTKAMRGLNVKQNLVTKARDGLEALRQQRANEYLRKLAKIQENKKSLDISSINSQFEKQLQRFNVERLDDGSFDFSRSTVSEPVAQANIQAIAETIGDWGKRPGDRTAIGLDLLKRRLEGFYSPNAQERAFTTAMAKSVKDILRKNVPGYEEMTKGYAQASEFIQDVEKSMSLGGRAGTESTINKLAQGLRQDKEFRTSVIRELEKVTGDDLTGPIAGTSLNAFLPRGLTGRLFAGGAVGTGAATSNLIISLLVSLPFFSPRIVGELTRALGLTAKQSDAILNAVKKIKGKTPIVRETSPTGIEQSLFQGGRVEELTEE